jgi:hypothetical protein
MYAHTIIADVLIDTRELGHVGLETIISYFFKSAGKFSDFKGSHASRQYCS